ncbi:CHAT domain-containing protein, partial [filamentous cyanobacterium LEGE 11480]
GLRSIPLAAMQNQTGAVIDRYSVNIIPSLGMLDRRQNELRNQTTLAIGASQFEQFAPLPAVPHELSMIQQQGFAAQTMLNPAFTLENTVQQMQQVRPEILHLATHANFQPGKPQNSFIQFWNQKLSINQLDQLQLRAADLELLVLSACNTASGNADAELGFTGMASLFGVRSALGTLWSISDLGTYAFMSEFYAQLANTPSRADALRKTQLAMQTGKVRVEQSQLITSNNRFSLPALLARTPNTTFTHPYYWSGFTLVGNPW